ncbi:MAG: glycosyltransferase family 4 protein [Clostridia bacterium]|nr:glycosyltransferase family 4 protein [Clostridia bacterium]
MKKVLFVATVESHIIHFHVEHLKLFKDKGYEVHVAAKGLAKIEYCDKHFNIAFERNPLKLNNMKAYKQLKKIINENNYEIIHCHTPVGGVLTRLAARETRKKGTKIFYTAHGFHFYKGAPLINWLIYYPIENWLSRYTDCLITINKEDYGIAKKNFKKCPQIELVNGVGVSKNKFTFDISNQEKMQLRKELNIKEDDFVIIYTAELSKRKNQSMAIKVLKQILDNGYSDVKVLLPGIDSMNGRYQALSKKLNVEKNIRFLGYRKDIPKLLNISDIAISTSKQEGLAVNIMEAMILGLPCIVTNCRGNRDLIEDQKDGYICEIDDVNDMTQKILNIKENKSKLNIFGAYARKEIQPYLLDNIIPKLKRLYYNE